MNPRLTKFSRAFTILEVIGVLAIIAILAAAIVPTIIKRVDQAAWTKEKMDLDTIADAYTQYILRNRYIPGATGGTNWAAAIANQISKPVSQVTTNGRRFSRAFLVDPGLSIGGGSLPYSQSNSAIAQPLNARVILVSSVSKPLPTITVTSNEFQALWNTPEYAKPATAIWTNWSGSGEDLLVRKLDLGPLFHRVILINHDKNQSAPFSIEGMPIQSVVGITGVGWQSYYLDGTVLELRLGSSCGGGVQTKYLVKQSISYVFEACSWRGAIEGAIQINPIAIDFFNSAVRFMSKKTNPGAANSGASQFSVLLAMYTFMFDFTLWADECPHFYRHGFSGNPSSLPEYKILNDAGQGGSGHIPDNSKNLIN